MLQVWETLKEKGDITDVFEMVNNDKQVLKQMEELEEKTPLYQIETNNKLAIAKIKKCIAKENDEEEIFEDDILIDNKSIKVKLKIPFPYKIENNEILKQGGKDKETGKTIWYCFSKNLVLIKSILEDIDTGEEKLELIYFKPNKNKWFSIIVDKNVLNNKSNILSLGNKGLNINSNNCIGWISYLSMMEQTNYENIPTIQVTQKLGWVNNTTFIPFANNEIMLDVDENSLSWISGYSKKGDINKWIEAMKPLRENNIFRLMLATSFVPPLLKYIDSRTFILNLWYASKSGKSASLYAALSAWGNPEELKITFNATLVGFERLASLFSDIVIGVDEKQVSHNKQLFETFIYMLNEGKSKLRGNKDGGLDKNLKWKTVAITTGEEPLTDNNFHSGAKNRVLDIYGKPFESEKEARNVYKIVKEEYGLAGPIFIKRLIQDYSNEGYKDLANKYKEIEERFNQICDKDIMSSYIQAVSSIVLADSIIGRYFFNTTIESSINMGKEILEKLPREDETSDIDRAYQLICSWIMENDSKFDRHNFSTIYNSESNKTNVIETMKGEERYQSEKFGLYEDGYYYILPHIFNSLMQENDMSSVAIKKQLAECGMIKVENDKNRLYYEVIHPYNGGRRRMIAFKMQNNDGTFENEDIPDINVKDNYSKIGNAQLDI